jgi:hypothetical protein
VHSEEWAGDTMKYKIEKKSGRLEIKIVELQGDEKHYLEAFNDCQTGRCTCPSQEYKKLDSMQVEHKDGVISLQLNSKEGTQFDEVEIERCLARTKARLKSQNNS